MFPKTSIHRDVEDVRALLTAADPVRGPLPASAAARLAALRHRIGTAGPAGESGAITSPPAARRRHAWWPGRAARQRRRRIVIACVAAPALAAASAAGWVIAGNTPASYVAGQVWCFSSPHGGGSVEIPASGQVPTAVCAQQWASGNMTHRGDHTVPPLVACSMGSFDGGSIGVYPDTTCRALHLVPVPAGYQQAAKSFAALSATLSADGVYIANSSDTYFRCVSAAAGTALARQALQSHGFTGWRVVVRPFPKGQPCAEDMPDSASHTILIIGSEP